MKGVYQILKKSVKSTFFLTRCTPSVFFKKGLGKSSKDTKKIRFFSNSVARKDSRIRGFKGSSARPLSPCNF